MIDLLAIGAHPDDVEIGVGGILAKHNKQGFSTGICNLTEAELSSNGTVESRRVETQRAANILGVSQLLNLEFPDRGLNSNTHLLKLTQVIRQLKPEVVLAPYFEDRHPDHVTCSKLVKEAVFDAALHKLKTPGGEEAHRVSFLYYYFLNQIAEPQIIIDISDVYEQKREALEVYSSQFHRSGEEIETPLNIPNFLEMRRGRDQMWGQRIGVQYGEALISPGPLGLDSLF